MAAQMSELFQDELQKNKQILYKSIRNVFGSDKSESFLTSQCIFLRVVREEQILKNMTMT